MSAMDAAGLADMCAWIVEDPEMAGANTALLLARALLAVLDACRSFSDDTGEYEAWAVAGRIEHAAVDAANERPEPDA